MVSKALRLLHRSLDSAGIYGMAAIHFVSADLEPDLANSFGTTNLADIGILEVTPPSLGSAR
jgi:hypothetical protein